MSGEKLDANYGVSVVRNVQIPMRDGVKLAADLFMPEQQGRYPALLEYIPYRKDDQTVPRHGAQHYFAQRGFVGVRLDVRGTGASEGVAKDEYSTEEIKDGYEAIEWLASQSWCSGKVGMWGSSYGGFSSIQAAIQGPPSLKAIVPIYASDDRYTDDCHYCGGALRAYYDAGLYGNFMTAMNALPPYPEISGSNWSSIWDEHLKNNKPWILEWLSHQTNDGYWKAALGRQYDRINCPVFVIGGWRDGYPNLPLRLFANLKTPKKLLIGPWAHVRPDTATPGPRIDYLRQMLRWFGFWLKGIDTGIMKEPPITLYVQEYDPPAEGREFTTGYWRYQRTWPDVDDAVCARRFYLHAKGLLEKSEYDKEDSSESYEYNPTVGVTAGLWSGGWIVALPVDQRTDEEHSLVHTTGPLTEDLEILGNPEAVLYVSSSSDIAFFVVKLCDVAPDGASALVCKGFLNATRRESLEIPKPLEADRVYQLTVPLDATCWLFREGHKIRVSIASSDWPNVWPSPKRAVNRLYFGPRYPSHVSLPIVGKTEQRLPIPILEPPPLLPETAEVFPNRPEWKIVKNPFENTVTVTARAESETRLQDAKKTRLESVEEMEATASSINPAQASVRGNSLKRIWSGDKKIEATSQTHIKSDADKFHVEIELNVRVDDEPRFVRKWTESFPRQLL